MSIKESYVIEGTSTTWGVEAFRNNVASADGLAVQRFKSAGAHFFREDQRARGSRGLSELQPHIRYNR